MEGDSPRSTGPDAAVTVRYVYPGALRLRPRGDPERERVPHHPREDGAQDSAAFEFRTAPDGSRPSTGTSSAPRPPLGRHHPHREMEVEATGSVTVRAGRQPVTDSGWRSTKAAPGP